MHNTGHEQFVFYPMKLKSVNLLCLSVGNHTFYFLSLVVPTCLIHVFSSCIHQGANNPLLPSSLCFLLFRSLESIQSLTFSISALAYSSHGKGKPEKLSGCSAVREMPSGSALGIGLGVSLTRNKPIKESPATA